MTCVEHMETRKSVTWRGQRHPAVSYKIPAVVHPAALTEPPPQLLLSRLCTHRVCQPASVCLPICLSAGDEDAGCRVLRQHLFFAPFSLRALSAGARPEDRQQAQASGESKPEFTARLQRCAWKRRRKQCAARCVRVCEWLVSRQRTQDSEETHGWIYLMKWSLKPRWAQRFNDKFLWKVLKGAAARREVKWSVCSYLKAELQTPD